MGPTDDDGRNVPTPPDDSENLTRGILVARLLPDLVIRFLQQHFYAGVKHAEVRFKYHAADEDSITGALGNDLVEPEPLNIQADGHIYKWSTAYYKIRGRGLNAPERKLGADGIFQFEVFDHGSEKMLLRKGLLFQSKKKWTGRDGDLLKQARDLLVQSPSAIVIDYSERGYRAFAASDVVAADGHRRKIRAADNKSLAEVLGDEFVLCKRGDRGLYWEPERERLVVGGESVSDLVPEHFIGNRIERIG